MSALAAPDNTHSRLKSVDLRRYSWIVAAIATLVLFAVNAWLQPSLTQPRVLVSNLMTMLPLMLVAIGQTYVILAGDIDLSVGAIVSVVNVTTVSVIQLLGGGLVGIAGGMAAGIGAGLACGLFNGVLVAYLRFQPIVTTFASGILFGGIALWILPQAGMSVPEAFWRTYGGAWLAVPVVIWIALAALVWIFVFRRTPVYRRLVATGGSLSGAYQSGVAVRRARVGGYAWCGVFAALTAICLTGGTATGDALIGQGFTLTSISAVVLGGTALSGGSGGALGSVLGAVILTLIANIIFFAGLPFEYQNLAKGAIVLAALAAGVVVARR